MPSSIEHRDDETGVVIRCWGIVEFSELDEINEQIYRPDRLQKLRYELIDFSRVEKLHLTSQQIRTLASADVDAARVNPRFIVAVVGEKDVVYGILRMWEVFVAEASIRTSVFRSLIEAEYWIARTAPARVNPSTDPSATVDDPLQRPDEEVHTSPPAK